MRPKSKILFYLPFVIILIMLYAHSWLPGNQIVKWREFYVGLCLGLPVILMAFEFNKFFSIQLSLSSLEKKLMASLALLATMSLFLANSQEIFVLKKLLKNLCLIFFIVIYFYIVPCFILDNPNYFETFIKLVSNFGLIASVFGFLMLLFNVQPLLNIVTTYMLISFINHPNTTSMIFTITIIPTLFYLYWKGNKLSLSAKVFYIVSLIMQVLAQLFTLTRAGMIAIVAGLSIFFILYYRSRFILLIPFFLLAVPTFIGVFFKAKGFASFAGRFYLLFPAFDLITASKTRLLWGYGVSTFEEEFRKNLLVFEPWEEDLLNDPHNAYVTLVLMMGVIFTFVFLFFVGLLLFRCLKSVFTEKKKKDALFFIFIFSSSISILVHSLFDAEMVRTEYFNMEYLLIIFGLIYFILSKGLLLRKPSLLANLLS